MFDLAKHCNEGIASATPSISEVHIGADVADDFDSLWQGWLSHFTLGLTPAGLTEAYGAWLAHLALCPGRFAELATFPLVHAADQFTEGARDSRFRSDLWKQWPWRDYVQTFHLAQAFWDRATLDIPGLAPAHTRSINFVAHQVLNAMSPANFLLTNPDILRAVQRSGGQNLSLGLVHFYEDWQRRIAGQRPVGMDVFTPGQTVAITPGKVIFRNDLIELIQYAPQTQTVHATPILILPAWIMKYYILDLSPRNSLVNWLVEQGHTVFMVSWKNPGSADRDKGMDDYVRDGALAALDAVDAIMPGQKINLAGYCLGGTLALIFAAWLAARHDDRLQSLSLFAAQGDFTEAGEIGVFVTDSEVAYLKNMMRAQGYLDTRQMAGAFQMLRSNDSLWSHMVRDYWLGQRAEMFDLLAWNADATRMPFRMHSEYLVQLFLQNAFANGHYKVLGHAVAPENITLPVFAVGTESDHVAPWRSVYKIHQLATGEIAFALTNGGHNAGIISEPGRSDRHYLFAEHKTGTPVLSADDWCIKAEQHTGSWWLAWRDWLSRQSDTGERPAPATCGSKDLPPLADAPGTYVHQR
jgi:polyhydroxyalkanoate synthase